MALNRAQRDRMGRGWEHHRNRRYAEAEPFYRQVFAQAPDDPEVVHLLGVVVLRQGRTDEALTLLGKAAALVPGSVEIQNDLGNALKQADRPDEALRHYDAALARAPERGEIHNNRGSALQALGRTDEAMACYAQALALKPNYPEAHRNTGQSLASLRRWPEALAAADRAISLRPTYGAAHGDRGRALAELRRPAEAYAALRRALDVSPYDVDVLRPALAVLKLLQQHEPACRLADRLLEVLPGDPETLLAKGVALWQLRQSQAALACFDQAIQAAPTSAAAWNSRGMAELQMNAVAAAEASFRHAMVLAPYLADSYSNLSVALLADRRDDEALVAVDAALARAPGLATAHFNRGLILLKLSGYRQGWREAEWRKVTEESAYSGDYRDERYAQPLWLGQEPIAGRTLFVYREQGLGDTVQFIRYAVAIAAMGAKVVAAVQPPLRLLLAQSLPTIQVIGADETPPTFDFHCPMLSLPVAVHEAGLPIPMPEGYLHAEPAAAAQWQDRLGARPGLRVGIAWSGNPKHRNDRNRSMPLEVLLPLLRQRDDIAWVVAQKDVSEADVALLQTLPQVARYDAELGDFADTAAMLAGLDLLISVDTSVVHLAGAMGRPAWLMLPYGGEWRWPRAAVTTEWYTSLRLFHQAARSDWAGVVAAVAAALPPRL